MLEEIHELFIQFNVCNVQLTLFLNIKTLAKKKKKKKKNAQKIEKKKEGKNESTFLG